MSETLLLTWTISPNWDIVKQWYKSASLDPNKRYFEYIDAILYYITQSDFINIIFCENSNFYFQDLNFINHLCEIYNKNFELLQFTWDYQKALDLWYGYWDAECIDYAIDKSLILRNVKNWYKISWRYKCMNINKIIYNQNKQDIAFFKWVNFSYFSICTAFFKCNNSFYNLYLYNSWEKMNKNLPLEMIFYISLRKFLLRNNCWSFDVFPFFSSWNNMLNINFFQYLILKTWLSSMWSKISFIFDKIFFKP